MTRPFFMGLAGLVRQGFGTAGDATDGPMPFQWTVLRDEVPAKESNLKKLILSLTTLAALAAGDETVPEVVRRVYRDVAPALHDVARLSVTSHLVKLEREGRVRRADGERFHRLD